MSASRQRTILLAEDNSIIAITLEDELAQAGFAIAGPFASCSSALTWLDQNTPDAAVLDVSLGDGPCNELASTLTQRGIPFVVHSGYGKDSASAEFVGAQWIVKPALPGAIAQALATTFAAEASYE